MEPDRARELLARERGRIESALRALRGEDDCELSHVDQHLADQASELYQRESDAGHEERLRDELAAIERAERRLADGTYGRCVETGEPIPDARLEVVPWAERTVDAQARHERGH